MPNYNISINSKFNPFSYQELLAPVMAETQAHRATEEAYGALDAEAAQWENLLDPEKDAQLYNQYKNYRQGIADMATKLNKEGMYQNAFNDVLAKKTQYVQDIVPIKNAYDRWQNDIKTQTEALAKDPTRIFDIDANALSTQDYYNNRGLNANTSQVSGELLRQQVVDAAKNYAKVLKRTGSLKSLGIPYQYTRELQHGASEQEIVNTILGNPNASPILSNIVQNVLKGSGIEDWNSVRGYSNKMDSAKYRQAYSIASTGLYHALGETTRENLHDTYGEKAALDEADFERKNSNKTPVEPNPMKFITQTWLDENGSPLLTQSKDIKKELQKFWDKWGDKTGVLSPFQNARKITGEQFDNLLSSIDKIDDHRQKVQKFYSNYDLDATNLANDIYSDATQTVPLNKKANYKYDIPDGIRSNLNLIKDNKKFGYYDKIKAAHSLLFDYLTSPEGKELLKDNYIKNQTNGLTKSLKELENSLGGLDNWNWEGEHPFTWSNFDRQFQAKTANLAPRGIIAYVPMDASELKENSENIKKQLKNTDGTYKKVFYNVDSQGNPTEIDKKADPSDYYIADYHFKGGTDSFDVTRGDAKKRQDGYYITFAPKKTGDKGEKTYFVPIGAFSEEIKNEAAAIREAYDSYLNTYQGDINMAYKGVENFSKAMSALLADWLTFSYNRKSVELSNQGVNFNNNGY